MEIKEYTGTLNQEFYQILRSSEHQKSYKFHQKGIGEFAIKIKELDGYLIHKRHKENFKEETIYANIIEINNDFYIMNCLIDLKDKIFQKRKFEKSPFQDLSLEVGDSLKILIETKRGEKKFSFIPDNSLNKFFEPKRDLFSKFAGTALFPNF